MSNETAMLQALGAVAGLQKEAGVLSTLARAPQALAGRIGPAIRGVGGRGAVKDWAAKGGVERLKGRLATGAVGSGIGAGAGAATGEEGERGRRALGGALLGGALGVGAGQFVTRAGRQQAERFAHRQLYGLTGMSPGKSLTGFADPAALASRAPINKMKRLEALGYNVKDPKVVEMAERGLLTAPGFVKGLVTKPVETLKRGYGYGGKLGLVAAGGLTAAELPAALTQTGQTGRAENIGRMIGENVGYFGGAPVPIIGNLALGSALGEVGARAGKVVGKVTGLGKPTGTGARLGSRNERRGQLETVWRQ